MIANKDLYSGINTVTLVDEKNNPLLERIFFNSRGAIKDFNFSLSKTTNDTDSISFKLRANPSGQENILKASISVLPSETKSYNPEHSIISAIHLKPYLKGAIENPNYYFKDFNRKKRSELDVLLITQGWSRYSWDRVFNFHPKPSFDFENGITINGFVNNKPDKISTLMMYPTSLSSSMFIPLDKEGKFTLKNFYPEAGEKISFSFVGDKGKIKKPRMSLSYISRLSNDYVNTSDYQSFVSYYQDKNDIPDSFILDDSYEELEEIKIKTDYKKKLREETRDPILVNGKVSKIGKNEVNQFPFILDYISYKGNFDVLENLGQVSILARTRGNNGVTPTVFLDGVIINGSLNILFKFPTENVERIVIDPTGIGLGLSGGFGGAIKIFTRRSVFRLNDDQVSAKKDIFTNISQLGFQPNKEFYTPKYASYQMQSFKDYGIIHWEPNLHVYNTESPEFKILDTKIDEVNFYIEGISSSGQVFSKMIKVDMSQKN